METKLFKVLFINALTFCVSLSVFSQNLQKKAEENPLDCSFYLLSKTAKDDEESRKVSLARAFYEVGRYTEIQNTLDLIENESYVEKEFIFFASQMIKDGKRKEALRFTNYLAKRFNEDSYNLKELPKFFILLNEENKADEVLEKLDESEKLQTLFETASVYLSKDNKEKALITVNEIIAVYSTEFDDKKKAQIGLFLAKLGKSEESFGYLSDSLKDVIWTTGIAEFDHAVIIDDVFSGYLELGKYDAAYEMLQKQGKTEDTRSLLEIAKSYLKKGNNQKGKEFIEKSRILLTGNDYSDSFSLGEIVEIYLDLGEDIKAVEVAKSISGNEYMRQKRLKLIFDHEFKKGNTNLASELLLFEYQQAKKIKSDEPESGLLSSSPKKEKAEYFADVASDFIKLKNFEAALKIINQIEKPYLRAEMLAKFTSEKNKISRDRKSLIYLNEALNILRTKDDELFDSDKNKVFAKIARAFAEIGFEQKSKEVFAEALSSSDYETLRMLANVGVEFQKSNIIADEKIKKSLRQAIKNYEADK
jgi:hypothetical protein